VPPLVMRLVPLVAPGSRPWEWVVSIVMQRVFFSPQTFFRTNAFCWAVDEDCHLEHGRRREAIHAGTTKLFEEEGRAVAFLLFLGLGAAGLQTRNCELVCVGVTERADCVDACELADIARQSAAVSEFVEAVLLYVVPAFSLLTALHIWLYPIHGERLQKLAIAQAVVFKKVGSTPMRAVEPTLSNDGAQVVPSAIS